MCVEYIGDVQYSTSGGGGVQYIGGYHEYIRGYHEYIRGYYEYIGGIPRVHWGYHEYIGECSLLLGDIMMHVGEQVDKSLSIYIENPDVVMISLTCIMISLLGVITGERSALDFKDATTCDLVIAM